MSNAFDIGFQPDRPTPQEIDSLTSKVAILQGTAEGLQKKATFAADQALAGPMKLADRLVGQLIEPANDLLAANGVLAQSLGQKAYSTALESIQGPLRTGIGLGYSPQGTPLLSQSRASKRKRAKRGANSPLVDGTGGDSAAGGSEASDPPANPLVSPGFPLDGPMVPPSVADGPLVMVAALPGRPIESKNPADYCKTPYDPQNPARAEGVIEGIVASGGTSYGIQPDSGLLGIQQVPIDAIPLCPALPAPPAPQPPGGVGGGIPFPPAQPPGGVGGGIPFPPAPGPRPIGPPLPPAKPPADKCCPSPPIFINIPPPIIPPCPQPAPVFIYVPPCPNCGAPGAPAPLPLPPWPPIININVPPCPNCGEQPGPISVAPPPLPPAPPASPPPPPGAPPSPPASPPEGSCNGLTLDWLSANHPRFVEAERAAGRSDNELLANAAALGLCPPFELSPDIRIPTDQQIAEEEFVVREKPRTRTLPDVVSADLAEAATKTTLSDCLPAQEVIGQIAGKTLFELLVKLGICDAEGRLPWYEDLWDSSKGKDDWWTRVKLSLGTFAANAEKWSLEGVNWVKEALATATGCNATDAGTAALVSVVIGLTRKWLMDLPPQMTQAWDYYIAWACPIGLPTAEWANEALARSFIELPEWRCLVKANGLNEYYQTIDAAMRMSQLSEDDALALFRRGKIDEKEWRRRMALRGWHKPPDQDLWREGQKWIPSPTDAVDWMIKDVADPQIQSTFLLGAEFNQKYSGHVKEVFDWNGVAREDAETIWRAHWRNMAPHQLYELHKRLRPGWTALMTDAEVTHLVEAICPRKPSIPGFDPTAGRPESNGFPVPTYCEELLDVGTQRRWLESLVTTGYHVSEALGQDDYPAFWRQRLLALSYKVITRVDARRAYETSQISQEKLQSIFQDQGYSPGDAQIIAGFYRVAAIQLHSRRPTCNQWIMDGYDVGLFKESMLSQGMREDMWNDVFHIVDTKRRIRIQIECIRAIKARYLKGVILETQARNSLAGLKLDGSRIDELIEEWNCLKRAIPKQENAQEICAEFKAGLITGLQAQNLLKALGYTARQATRILSLCYLKPMPKGLKHMPKPGSPEFVQMQEALES